MYQCHCLISDRIVKLLHNSVEWAGSKVRIQANNVIHCNCQIHWWLLGFISSYCGKTDISLINSVFFPFVDICVSKKLALPLHIQQWSDREYLVTFIILLISLFKRSKMLHPDKNFKQNRIDMVRNAINLLQQTWNIECKCIDVFFQYCTRWSPFTIYQPLFKSVSAEIVIFY